MRVKTGKSQNIKSSNKLSFRLKERIKGLVEKKLTIQTVSLFAQEYENYDLSSRISIAEFIGTLMDEEARKFLFMAELVTQKDENTFEKYALIKKTIEFEERQINFKKIQDILIKREMDQFKKVSLSNAKDAKLKEIENMKLNQIDKEMKEIKFSKPEKINALDKIEKPTNLEDFAHEMHREFLDELNANNGVYNEGIVKKHDLVEEEKEQQKQLKFTQKVNPKSKSPSLITKKTNDKKVNKIEIKPAKVSKESTNSVKDIKIKNTKKDNQLLSAYEEEQIAKQKLREELFGKSKDKIAKVTEEKIDDKKLKITEPKEDTKKVEVKTNATQFTFAGTMIDISEYNDPKNRLYIYWQKIKKAFKLKNISEISEKISSKKQIKLNKKRLKFINKIKVNNKVVTPTPETKKTPSILIENSAPQKEDKQTPSTSLKSSKQNTKQIARKAK